MTNLSSRRNTLKKLGLGSVLITGASLQSFCSTNETGKVSMLKGNVNHSVCRWTQSFLTVEELCLAIKEIGFSAMDIVGPKDWPTLKKHGIFSSMCNGAEISLTEGWTDTQYHSTLIDSYLKHIDLVADAGYKNLICFSGNRRGMDDQVGLENCVTGLKKIMSKAESRGVIVQMELLNSKINHKDYMCDLSSWGIELVKRIDSPNFKLLYDIYHMQIDEGDVIRTIQDNHQYFGHYHTGGVPGRNMIDDTQELYYPAIIKAIMATGYDGYLAQEFISTQKETAGKIAELEKAVVICDV